MKQVTGEVSFFFSNGRWSLTIAKIFCLLCTIIFSHNAFASEKFSLKGNTLVYDTFVAEDASLQEITWDDVDELEIILKDNSNISSLELNSSGGDVAASNYMADLIIDYELDTVVNGTCESACTIVFLGGNKRTINRGSWLGFHQSYWSEENINTYYEQNKEYQAWNNPFEFASWLYEDTQNDILKNLEYLIERGVAASFAIRTMQATSDDMWYPRRKELEEAGVINN